MTSTAFDRLLKEDIPKQLAPVVKKWSIDNDNRWDNFYTTGIYVYTETTYVYTRLHYIIHVVFLDSSGIHESMRFVSEVYEEVSDVLYTTLGEGSPYTVSYAFTPWEIKESDILTKCEGISSNGILVTNGCGIAEDIREVRYGRRVETSSTLA